MSLLELNDIVQPPSAVQAPVFLDTSETQQLGGLFDEGRLCWSIANGVLYISDTSSGACLQNWAPNSAGDEVTGVCELRGPAGSLLVIAIEGYGHNMVGVLSANWGRLIRGISIPDKVTTLHSFNFEGFPGQSDGFQRCDMFPNSVLSLFNGIVAVGTASGHVYLIDLQLGVKSANDCLDDPSPMHVIEGPVKQQDIASMSESGHVTVEVTKGRFQRGKFMHLQSGLPTSSVIVTAMYFVPQVSALLIGYSFGGFQVYDLLSFQLLHSSPLTPLPPVTHFTYVEPENDPRKFVYVWVVRGSSHFVEARSGANACLYQMIFAEKMTDPSGHTLYRGFQGCGLRYEQVLNDDPSTMIEQSGTRVLGCATPLRYRQEQPGHSPEVDLSQAVLTWIVPSRHQSMSGSGSGRIFVALFDVNQWYHSQMPRAIRWKSKGKHMGVFGCSYFCFYDVTSAIPTNENVNILDAFVDQLLPFNSNPPMPETFMWPSAARFNLKLLTDSCVVASQCLGVQRMVLEKLDECRGSLFAQPEVLFSLCARAELLPPTCDHTPSRDLTTQRAALLSVVVTHNAPSRILTAFADSWTGAGGNDPVIRRWAESTRAELEQTNKLICTKVFSDDTPHTPISAHWRRMATIEVLLQRLLSRGFEREEKTGSIFDPVNQLYLTVASHKRVAELVHFLNKQGLATDYPAAALRRRYQQLRGTTELGSKLAIDCLIENHHGNGEDSTPLYPPPSLLSFIEFLMTFDPLIQHCLVLYLLCDLGSLVSPHLSLQSRYAASQELPSSLVNTIHSLWVVDNLKFKDPAYQIEATVLYMNTSVHPLFPWQHSVIVERLMQCGAVTEALQYLQCHGRSMQGPEELKLKLGVYVGNSLITEAYRTLSQFEGSESYNELFQFFMECCIEGKCLHLLLELPLNPLAETTFVLYMEQHPLLICRELLVFYFIVRHRFVEALAVQEKLRPFAKSDPDPNALEQSQQRDSLLAGLATLVPSSLQHLKQGRDKWRSQSSKVKVQVEKSLSSVVAKAIKYEGVSGGGGAVYSLVQSLAEKRLASSDHSTPLRSVQGSITELSHTPFLSTPVSVKKIRAPLTGSRPHPIITPTPRSRPLTPQGSHTHQRFVSHMQGFKDRMGLTLSHRNLELSSIQSPSPTKPSQLIGPVVTPTSILKGSRSGSKLLTDKRIRFAVERSPSQDKEKQHPLHTPYVTSSLSTTKASVALVTPLPSSDDDDLYESPVESPSQLHSPTPSHTSTHSSPLDLQTKLDYRDAEDDLPIKTGMVGGVAMETTDAPDVRPVQEESSFVEEDPSFVEQDMSEDDESITPAQNEPLNSSEDVNAPSKFLPLPGREALSSSAPKVNQGTPPSDNEPDQLEQSSGYSEFKNIKLTRKGLTSGMSLKVKKVVSSSTSDSLFPIPSKGKHTRTPSAMSSLFGPITPASQFFSPIPFLSDLIQAKKDKLHSTVEQIKQRDISSIKTPHKTTPSTIKVSQLAFSPSIVPSVGMATSSSYTFTPPTQVPIDAHHSPTTEEPEPMTFVFSPPLTRSAARKRREGSISRETSVEPSIVPKALAESSVVKKRGRRSKVSLPPTDDIVTLVTPPTGPRPLKEQPKKPRGRGKPVHVGSRRSARLLGGKK